jgi:hypothetical protein
MSVLLTLFIMIITGGRALDRSKSRSRAVKLLRKTLRRAQMIWKKAALHFKLKALVGLGQCVAAAPGVFNVDPPYGLEELTEWINLIELPADLTDLVVPATCFGSYGR